jgi:hypothetical protein
MRNGEILYRGTVDWTINEDSIETLDVPLLPLGDEDRCLLSIRNCSATVDLTVDIGTMEYVYQKTTTPRGTVACLTVDAGDLVTCVGHGLTIGDCIVFGTVAGNTVVGTKYYVISTADANTFQFATVRGAAAFTVDATAGANTFTISDEFFVLTSVFVPKAATGSTILAVPGLVTRVIAGWPFGTTGGRLAFMKSAAAAAVFNASVEIRRL